MAPRFALIVECRRRCARAILVGIACGALNAWAVVRIPLASALDELSARGTRIVYSSALVPPDLVIDLDEVTLESVRSALPTVGLALERRNDLWLVVEGPRRAPHPLADERRSGDAEIETIIVTGTRHRFAAGPADDHRALASEELDRAPTLGGDSLRIVNLLPGMATMGVSVLPRIRGGLPNETLTLLDGVELLDPSHFAAYQDLFSSVDSRTIDGVDVYSGGFPARYGNRMSGVMEINTLAQRDKPPAEIGVSLYSLFANARSPDPASPTDWLLSARHSESDALMQRLDLATGRPDFTDATMRVGHAFSPDAKVYVGGFVIVDDIALSDDKEQASSKIDSRYLWSRFDGRLSEHVDNSTIVTFVSSRREKDEASPPTEDVVGLLHDTRDAQRVALRSDFGVAVGNSRQEFGLEADWASGGYDSRALIDRGPVGVLFGGGRIVAHDIHTTIDGSSGGLYWSADLPIVDGVSVQPGLRWDFQNYANGFVGQTSPRLGIRWQATDALSLRADAGRYYQPDRVYDLDTADGDTHLSKPQRADHYIASGSWASTATRLRLEAYEKRYEHCTPRFENLFNPFVLLPELADDRVEVDTRRARARGIDFEWQRELSAQTQVIARYSYMDADDDVDGRWVARRWSQHHTVTGIGSWTNGEYGASAAVTWHSGWRTSAPPESSAPGAIVPIQDVLDNRVLRDYLSIDIGVSAQRKLGRSTATIVANVTNVLDRKNVVGIDYDATETPDAVLLSPDHTSLLPIVPWVGIVVAF